MKQFLQEKNVFQNIPYSTETWKYNIESVDFVPEIEE